jgi:hypothetical protein
VARRQLPEIETRERAAREQLPAGDPDVAHQRAVAVAHQERRTITRGSPGHRLHRIGPHVDAAYVSPLARLQRADLGIQSERRRTAARRGGERLPGRAGQVIGARITRARIAGRQTAGLRTTSLRTPGGGAAQQREQP